jgi:hypothetical protein
MDEPTFPIFLPYLARLMGSDNYLLISASRTATKSIPVSLHWAFVPQIGSFGEQPLRFTEFVQKAPFQSCKFHVADQTTWTL